MRVLICPKAFDGWLTAVQAAEAMAVGWRRRADGDLLTLAPLSAGGPGFLDVMAEALGGMTVGVTVSDPLGRPAPAAVLVVEQGGVRTAYVEAAQACGLHLLSASERNPMLTSTLGVGQLLTVALSEGAQRVVVALGGSATNDGGAGLLAALGVGDPARLACGGARLSELDDDALLGVHEHRARWRSVELVIATDDDRPLLGPRGPSATTAAVKGATALQALELEAALGRFAEVVDRAVPGGKDLLTGLDRRFDREPGAGASGGLGLALLALGGRRHSAVRLAMDAWRFDDLLARHDLVLTGEGRLDYSSLSGSVVAEVTAAASARALPTVVLAGQVQLGRREVMALGVAGCYAVVDRDEDLVVAEADPVGTVEARAARVAATWSG